MGLAACRDCGQQVSASAKVCPHCGVKRPVPAKRGRGCAVLLGIVAILVIGTILINVMLTPAQKAALQAEEQRQAAAAAQAQREYALSDASVLEAAHSFIAKTARDAGSLQWSNEHARVTNRTVGLVVVCGEVNGRNAFGGMTGARRYVFAGRIASVGIADNRMASYATETDAGFVQLWNRECASHSSGAND